MPPAALACLVVAAAVVVAAVHADAAPVNLDAHLDVLGHLSYPGNTRTSHCNYSAQLPCGKLNDVWGYEYVDSDGVERYQAIVGLTDGTDFVDVTDPTSPRRVAFDRGCLNGWRDYKTYGKFAYGISEYTESCDCYTGRCLLRADVHFGVGGGGGGRRATFDYSVGRLAGALNASGVDAALVKFEPYSSGGCVAATNAAELAGTVAVVARVGSDTSKVCMFTEKIKRAQDAGARAVLIVNDYDDIVYPGMEGAAIAGLTIPGMLVSSADGAELLAVLDAGTPASLHTNTTRYDSPLYGEPEGLMVFSLEDPRAPRRVSSSTHDFPFAHNVFTEFDRPYLYVCGMSTTSTAGHAWQYIENGGVLAFSLNATGDGAGGPEHPLRIGAWNTTYVHDLTVRRCAYDGRDAPERHYMFAAGINDDTIHIIDAEDPSDLRTLVSWPGRQSYAHNIWPSGDCSVLYVTHEQYHEAVTVWQPVRDARGKVNWSTRPRYLGSLDVGQFNGTLPHNVFVRGDELWASYYSEGVVVWNVSTPTHPQYMARVDTSPRFTGGFGGVWGVYPYASTGVVYASDQEEGLFLLRLVDGAGGNGTSPSADDNDSTELAVAITMGVLLGVGVVVVAVLVYKVAYKTNEWSRV